MTQRISTIRANVLIASLIVAPIFSCELKIARVLTLGNIKYAVIAGYVMFVL